MNQLYKKTVEKIQSHCIRLTQLDVENLLNELIREQKKISEYEGMTKTLETLNINPFQWADLKNKKVKITISKL